jgi:tRNA(Ile)-lysidine synthase
MKLACPVPADAFVSVSGGIDSVVAFHYLHKKFGVKRIFHFNHNCQPINKDMEDAARALACDFGAAMLFDRAKTILKTEAGFRKARLAAIFDPFFHGHTLVTGHHLDDAVESHLLNVIRGKDGFLPMPIVSHFDNDHKIVHPFLLTPKADLQQYALTHGLEKYIVSDPTNEITKGSRRNFLRNIIIPLLEKENVGMRKIVKKKLLAHIANAK